MKKRVFFLISIIILVIDQIIKYWINITKPTGRFIHYVNNTGAVFGMFQGYNNFFALATALVIGLIIYYYIYHHAYFKNKYVSLSAALILGGACGNLMDRIISGYVIDYLDVGFWPVFNLADIALTIGAIILIITYWNEK
jgi:signal peptidase II